MVLFFKGGIYILTVFLAWPNRQAITSQRHCFKNLSYIQICMLIQLLPYIKAPLFIVLIIFYYAAPLFESVLGNTTS
jgi:hypothetical protein